MKKVKILTYSLLLTFMMLGCTAGESVEEKNIKSFLKELYQVESTDDYQNYKEKSEEYIQEMLNEGKKNFTFDEANGAELLESFTSKYTDYCSEAAMQTLIANRHIIRYDRVASEENCQFYVKEIVLEKQNEYETYFYTIHVERRSDDHSTELNTGEGIIRLNEEGFVDWFKIVKDL